MMPMMYQQQTGSLNLRLAQNNDHNLTSSTLIKISLSKPNKFLHFSFQMMSAYECVLSFPHSGQGEPLEPPPKKRRVISKKSMAAKKKIAHPSGPLQSSPP